MFCKNRFREMFDYITDIYIYIVLVFTRIISYRESRFLHDYSFNYFTVSSFVRFSMPRVYRPCVYVDGSAKEIARSRVKYELFSTVVLLLLRINSI